MLPRVSLAHLYLLLQLVAHRCSTQQTHAYLHWTLHRVLLYFYPYYPPPPPHSGPRSYPYPYPYAPYVSPPHQPATTPPQPATGGPSIPTTAEQATEGHMSIEPDGDTYKYFYWLPQHNDKIRKNFEKRGSNHMRDMFIDIRKSGQRQLWMAVLGREPTLIELHSHTHKQWEDQQWEEYTRIRESQVVAGEGSSGGSTEYSDYHTWS
ncbi:hypothetical protein IEQ34_018329 [Dendrobium chrysotoxum]|uniref:Uncharacterized protein n=1 Tax=Dendrobium chrysotoxum TaxID=161865 RepID=A0AAV7FW74_DENCH|nr:hypothetical protein IEQ34_018329 [Dendrobium chrysotoxum]